MINWPILIIAIMQVESNMNTNAYNAAENAVGPAQIRQICLDDLNRQYCTEYRLSDFRNKALSAWAIIHYGRMYKAKTEEEAARIWNGGPDGAGEPETLKYWLRVKLEFDRLLRCERSEPNCF